MRAAVQRLSLADPTGATGLRRAEDAHRHPSHDVAWASLTRCSSAARRALVRWPSRTETRIVRSPIEVARGTELVDKTERRLGLSIDVLAAGTGTVAPEVTLRRVGSMVPWTNRTLAAVASRVIDALRASESAGVTGQVPTTLIAPIRAMARLARPALPATDPPFSSWPPAFLDAYLACVDVLASVSVGGSKKGWVPLADLWRLYEMWLAERVLAVITRLLGTPTWISGPSDERVCVRWATRDWELELRHPCVFTNEARTLVGSRWWSVSSRLEPDIGLLARTPAGARLVVLDAKERQRLTAGDVAVEASKYQWGIRRDLEQTLGVQAVVLVAPCGGDEPYDRPHAQHWAIHGHPNAGQGMPPGEVGTDLCKEFVRGLLEDQLLIPQDAFLV